MNINNSLNMHHTLYAPGLSACGILNYIQDDTGPAKNNEKHVMLNLFQHLVTLQQYVRRVYFYYAVCSPCETLILT